MIVDSGPLVALIDEDDSFHAMCVVWLEQAMAGRKLLIVPVPVITEVCYLLCRTGGAEQEAKFLEELASTTGIFSLFSPSRTDLTRMARLIRDYADMSLGLADACVLTAAEKFGTTEVATVDQRLRAVRLYGDQHLLIVP